jgi:adenylosuccinate lyase
MPHKVNPIDFENAEGNLSKANADLRFLGEYVVTSRLQRDLSDSTVKRNVGAALAHCLIGYTKTAAGLATVVPNEAAMRADLDAEPAVLAEAVQTALRAAGHDDAYERVKAATRGRDVSLDDLRAIVRDADLDEATRERLLALDPADYVGLAPHLAREGVNGRDHD